MLAREEVSGEDVLTILGPANWITAAIISRPKVSSVKLYSKLAYSNTLPVRKP